MTHSIAFRFNLTAGLIVLTLLVTFGYYNYQNAASNLARQQTLQLQGVVNRLQQSLPAVVWNFDEIQLRNVVESESAAPSVRGVFVFDGTKQLLGRMTSESGELISSPLPEGDALGNHREEQLIYTDESEKTTVGRVIVLIDDSEMVALRSETLLRTAVQIVVMVGALMVSITLLMRQLVSAPIHEVVTALEDIAKGDGDLTHRLKAGRRDEIGKLAIEFNQFVDKIHKLVREIVSAVDEINQSTRNLQTNASQSNREVSSQREETDSVATAMNQMGSTAMDVARNAQLAADAARRADEQGRLTSEVVVNAMTAVRNLASDIQNSSQVINDLEKEVENITSVLGVIRGIAEQTNLLALNAAIEAARAGEQGRGFAVVADEVRTLASRTQSSTEEIQHMISRLQAGTQKAVSVMENSRNKGEQTVAQSIRAEEALGEIARAVETINEMNTQIASAAEEQTAVTEDINRSLTRIVEIAEATAEGTLHTEQASKRLGGLVGAVQTLVGQFRI